MRRLEKSGEPFPFSRSSCPMWLAGEVSVSRWLFRGANIGQFQWAIFGALFAEEAFQFVLQLVLELLLQFVLVLVELLLDARLGQLLEVGAHGGVREGSGDVQRNVRESLSGSGAGGRRFFQDRCLDLVIDGVI